MKHIICVLLVSTILISCEKEPVLEYTTYKPKENVPTVEDNFKNFPLKIIWYKPIHIIQPSSNHTSGETEIHLDESGLSIFYDYDKFSSLETENGNSLTNTSVSIGYGYYINYHKTIGGIISSPKKIISIDKLGNEALLYLAPDSIYIDKQTNLHGDDYYFKDYDYFNGTCTLYKLNVVSKQCELISFMDGEKLWGDDFRATIQLPVFFKFDDEEYELSSFTMSSGAANRVTYSSCKRLSDGSIIWENDDLFPAFQNNIIMHNNNLILNGGSHICKVSMTTGKKMWEVLPTSLQYFSYDDINVNGGKVYNDKLFFFFKGIFRELDLYTGKFTSLSSMMIQAEYQPNLVISNGIAYWSEQIKEKPYLFGMRISNLAIVLKALSPNYGIAPYGSSIGFLAGKMEVDIAKNIGYISDGHFIYCIQLL